MGQWGPPMTNESAAAATLRILEEELLRPTVRSSPDRVATLIADIFVEFGGSGHVYDKAQVVAGLADEHRQGPQVERTAHDLRVRMLAEDVAHVTYRAVRRHPDGTEANSLRSSIWKVIDERWQMTFHQGTPIPPRQ